MIWIYIMNIIKCVAIWCCFVQYVIMSVTNLKLMSNKLKNILKSIKLFWHLNSLRRVFDKTIETDDFSYFWTFDGDFFSIFKFILNMQIYELTPRNINIIYWLRVGKGLHTKNSIKEPAFNSAGVFKFSLYLVS